MKTLFRIFVAAVIIGAFLYASSADYVETVLYNMNESTYTTIVEKLGKNCTAKEVVNEYISNKKYYDNTVPR